MENRIKELIAVGASVSAHCQPCLEYHVKKALQDGATKPEVAEAIEVGKLVGKGAMAKMNQFADYLLGDELSTKETTVNSCCG